jgi:hypothetical protein
MTGPPEGRCSMLNNMKLPVGIENFEEIRTQGFYYVDKTELISDLLNGWGKVNLFTRPRRFGKTLNMSMLKSFFEVGGNKSIFDGLAIAEREDLCSAYMGKYPVVFISLKGVDGLTFEDAYERLRQVIRDEAFRLNVLQGSSAIPEAEKSSYLRIINEEDSPADIVGSLKLFCNLLEKHYGQKAILLIDEYDVPLDKAYLHGYYDRMIDIIRSMFNAALKTNDSLFFAVMTGCLRVSRESIFTGLNNPKIHAITDVKYDECFGFTEDEVGKMLADYGLEAHLGEAREWYDGYLFGEQKVYCPWDVINYCDDLRSDPQAEPKAYWMNTSGNDMVRNLIKMATTGTARMEIEDLIEGRTVTKFLNEQLTHSEINKNITNVWSLLYMTGYLTVTKRPTKDEYVLHIPNREIRQIFKIQVLEWFNDKASAEAEKLADLYTAFENGDTTTITDYLNKQLIPIVSYYDAHESFYHGFLLALLNTCADWRVSSNVETGIGRADIIVEREDNTFGCVVEVKDVKAMNQLDTACEAAMKQTEEKDYTAVLRRFCVEKIWTYGIAFCGKRCKVVAKQVC